MTLEVAVRGAVYRRPRTPYEGSEIWRAELVPIGHPPSSCRGELLVEAAWKRIGAYVVCRDSDGGVLLTRFDSLGHPDSGMWTLPGGGIEWGESAEMAAVRELAEESGLSAELGPVLGIYSRWYTAQDAVRGEPGHHFGVIFSSTSVAGDLRVDFDDDDSTDAAGWFSLAEMREIPLVPLAEFTLTLLE